MAQSLTFQSTPIVYQGGNAIAELSGHTSSWDSGDEDMFGQDGFLGASTGIIMTNIDCDMVVPVSGLTSDIVADFFNRGPVTLQMKIGLKFYTGEFRVTNLKLTSDSRAGTTRMSATFHGPKPIIT